MATAAEGPVTTEATPSPEAIRTAAELRGAWQRAEHGLRTMPDWADRKRRADSEAIELHALRKYVEFAEAHGIETGF